MSIQVADAQEFTGRLEERRGSIDAFLRAQRPRSRRLVTTAIASSGAAAVFTAGPAFGGPGFATTAAEMLNLSTTSSVWQVLCLAAMVVSVVATVAANVSRSSELTTRVATAEVAGAELEGVATLLRYGQIELGDAVKLYQSSTSKIPFVPAP